MWAAWKGKVGVVEWLIASSAKLDRQEKWGRTALILAADEGHLDVVRFWNGCFPVNFALLSLFFAVRFGCFSKPVPKLTFLRCERLSLYLHPSLRVSLRGAESLGMKAFVPSLHLPLQKTSLLGTGNQRCK